MSASSTTRQPRPRTVTGPPGRGRPLSQPESYRHLTPFQSSVNQLEKELFRSQRKRINESLDEHTADFKRYEARYRRTVKRAQSPSNNDELITASKLYDVILVGDYHTHQQSQRAFYRLLRAQPKTKGSLVIALEMIPAHCQGAVDKFLAGRIQEKTFLKRIRFEEHWPFGPFSTYRPIFDLAKQRNWRVIGIDSENHQGDVLDRDHFAAALIATELQKNPNARVFTLIGEMHLAPGHLPKSTQEALKHRELSKKILRVHQNPESIWFDFADRGLAIEHDVVRVSDDAFALLTASPVVCQQTFLTWLEQLQGDEFDECASDPDVGEKHVVHAVSVIDKALKLKAKSALKLLQVVDPSDLAFFELLQHSGIFSRSEMKAIRKHILSVESCYIPKARLIYLATLSMNHAAEEAAHMLRHHCSRESMDDPKGLVDAFYFRTMNEAIAFFGSKIVNPKRKCVHRDGLKKLINSSDLDLDPTRRQAAKWAIEHQNLERGQAVPHLAEIFQAHSSLFNAVTHMLGYILGDKLYYALVRNQVTPKEARSLFFEPLEEEGSAMLMYFEWTNRLAKVRVPQRP